MNRTLQTVVMLAIVSAFLQIGLADTPTVDAGRTETLRLGAVAYAPSSVTVFRDLTRYLTKNGLSADFILYSNYDALVDALERNEVDVAWNTPLAHGQYHVKNQCSSRTLVMRDVDFNVRSITSINGGRTPERNVRM
jgi:ABC-type phosphate/phosphonate transport system substrate-binding protein